jgi:hypothetical protein
MLINEMGVRPVAARTPTRMPAGGAAVGTLVRIIHSGHTGAIIVTGSVTDSRRMKIR